MKILKQLSIKASNDLLIEFAEKIRVATHDNYQYLPERAKLMGAMLGKEPEEILYFKSSDVEGVCAFISLFIQNDLLQLSNIVQSIPDQLTVDQYNSVIDDFNKEVVEPFLDNRLQATVSSGSQVLSDYMGEEAAEKLKIWAEAAIKRNTYDFDAWAAFIIVVHRKKFFLKVNVFEKILKEEFGITDQKWLEELKMSFDLDLRLLEKYDQLKPGR